MIFFGILVNLFRISTLFNKHTFMKQSNIEKELRSLYKKLPEMKKFLRSLGCPKEKSEDIFQEALLVYVRKVEEGIELSVEPFFYVRNTCKFLWYNQSRKESKNQEVEIGEAVSAEESSWLEKENLFKQMEEVVNQLDEACRNILQFFYGLSMSMDDIAKKVGLRSGKVVKVQKHRCLKKAKELAMAQVEVSNLENWER